jgi:plastocyanin
MTRYWLGVLLAVTCRASDVSGQSVLERSPGIHGVWGLPSGNMAFVFAHRFEVRSGGDEVTSIPTFTLAAGVPLGLTLGVDFTTYSEVVPEDLTANEAQYWLKRPFSFGDALSAAPIAAYNTAADSFEGALDVRVALGRIDLFAEGRAHSSLFGSGDFGASGTAGAAVHINRYLAITGDYGTVLTEGDVPGAWSAAVALAIPASPHTLSLQVTNGGATTFQGASREKTTGTEDVRYGFTFTVPLGNGSRWRRLIDPEAPAPAAGLSEPPAHGVFLSNNSFARPELEVRVGELVRWVNQDPVAHSVAAVDGSWSSGRLETGEQYQRVFVEPGRYEYVCGPHPWMKGVVVVGS